MGSPTRAECTDVANSILDGSDAVMLSGESANGLYPVKAVTMLRKLSEETAGEVVPVHALSHRERARER